jgi:hypothetical protein
MTIRKSILRISKVAPVMCRCTHRRKSVTRYPMCGLPPAGRGSENRWESNVEVFLTMPVNGKRGRKHEEIMR